MGSKFSKVIKEIRKAARYDIENSGYFKGIRKIKISKELFEDLKEKNEKAGNEEMPTKIFGIPFEVDEKVETYKIVKWEE